MRGTNTCLNLHYHELTLELRIRLQPSGEQGENAALVPALEGDGVHQLASEL